MRSRVLGFVLCLLAAVVARAQPEWAGAARIRFELERLRVLGSALMIAAHPDDENTALLAWLARGRKLRTAYLSLTRGEGGQNLIGPEQGDALGVIRTQELLAARRLDLAEQYFTRAVDFGFSKSAEETLAKWGREQVLADMVWLIRSFRPDIVILRFSGSARDGHGHHQASALLGREAFEAAGDPSRFPEQLAMVKPWRPRRLLWNAFGAPGKAAIEVDVGAYDPLSGSSFTEIAGLSRSLHRSQGFGAPLRRGSTRNALVVVAGEPASRDPMEGIETSWRRIPGGEAVDEALGEALHAFRWEDPSRVVPALARARRLMSQMREEWAAFKLRELDETIALCAGLWLDAAAESRFALPGQTMRLRLEAVNRSQLPVRWLSTTVTDTQGKRLEDAPEVELPENQLATREMVWKFAADTPFSAPFWLLAPRRGEVYGIPEPALSVRAESPAVLEARFRLSVGPTEIEIRRPVRYRYVDRVLGEQTRRLEVVPPVALRLPTRTLLFPQAMARSVEVELRAQTSPVAGHLRLELPAGWKADPAEHAFRLEAGAGAQATFSFRIEPPVQPASAAVRAVARVNGREIAVGIEQIEFAHIEPVTLFPAAEARLVRADVKVLARRVGYVMGAGDEIPEALRQMGCEVTLLGGNDLAHGDLDRFDAIVTGVRAYNVRADLRAAHQRLMGYVERGGTLVVQYNTLEGGPAARPLPELGPYPMRIGRERVTVEDAPVQFPDPDHPLLLAPNRITAADFEGWVQERGLYFATEWDPRYQPLFASHDPGEKPLAGGTLAAKHGRGVYVFTAWAWFRQLPAGVPGAYRIFANLISAGKAWR
ncbi:MAG: PIG-L family deacetylase [Bryobacterales bacterium]|nr:PIG-L family deacetylase [Bryobacteraceae bacterium]MDW8130151.1 PIG-L family deacetylase [Bryobacterales bacterium]